jgi:hypothetical protein
MSHHEDARHDVPRSSYITLDHVRSHFENADTESDTQQARSAAVSDGPKGNKLRVELIFPESHQLPMENDSGYSAARPS